MQRVVGLDAIRFVCAAVVALGHIHLALADQLSPVIGRTAATGVDIAFSNGFNGPAAVMVFFVLSGFVIHLPQARGRRLDVAQFAARRYLRIVPPVAVFMLASVALGYAPEGGYWMHTVLWSVICELVYYTLYPALLASRIPMARLGLGALGIALVFTALNFSQITSGDLSYTVFGWWTPVIGLPVWILGAVLAERYQRLPVLRARTMWTIRAGVLLGSAALRVLAYHGEPYVGPFASNAITLTLLAPLIGAWLGLEVVHFQSRPGVSRTLAVLETAGAASFSLYLAHPLALELVPAPEGGGDLALLGVSVLAASAATAAFYLLVERPSHRAARRAGQAIARRRAMAMVPARPRRAPEA
ncbi:acyltransferase family protein [Demequina mangrovi]|uniref:Peptidoglycan/LPS O-acetylase OafA/YrhL, contains acyltransferase and SGNH-hydrolase domains n=1 Tax=Demequina mangrovi TaxID=1043493 RepID=A0A1H6YPR0_9MICO|nr:acyltransferase [Demequina mangrovi]SEJ39242.1 Peptidoglycan/LPS O-acetylase OafA/YrhL, contains acyltransferase and SGNH-hydrolase domains [Demequina mangrovi]